MKEDGVSLLGLWLLVLVVVLLQCRIWLHPINPDLQIQVDGDTFKVYRKGKWEDAHRFSEITKVRMYHPYIEDLGSYKYGSEMKVTVLPFRAALVKVTNEPERDKIAINGIP